MPTLQAPDGTALHWREWPPSAPARGSVLIVHGLGEHGGRYDALARVLAADGWRVLAYDHRGHGRSGGARARMPRADSLLRDLAAAVDALTDRQAGPRLLLGHSMGGLVAARFVAEGLSPSPADWWRDVDGLVLSSPALDPGMTLVQRALLALLGPLAPDLAVGNGLRSEWLSHDPEVVRAYDADALVHDRVSARLVRFIVDGGEQVRACAPRWRVPTLLQWGGADRCVAPAGSAAFAAAAPREVVEAHAHEALRHEIFNEREPERSLVIELLRDWLSRRFAAVTP